MRCQVFLFKCHLRIKSGLILCNLKIKSGLDIFTRNYEYSDPHFSPWQSQRVYPYTRT